MLQSLLRILVHVVFSTKDRMNLFVAEIKFRLYRYICGIIKNKSAKLSLMRDIFGIELFVAFSDGDCVDSIPRVALVSLAYPGL